MFALALHWLKRQSYDRDGLVLPARRKRFRTVPKFKRKVHDIVYHTDTVFIVRGRSVGGRWPAMFVAVESQADKAINTSVEIQEWVKSIVFMCVCLLYCCILTEVKCHFGNYMIFLDLICGFC